MTTVSVIDYGMGNIHSVAKALEKVSDKKDKIIITNSIKDIKESSHIVFPGQGAARSCMKNIRNTFDIDELREIFEKKFFLGICMGLQVLMTESDEGTGEKCLDIFSGKVKYLGDFHNKKHTLPHMGWNNISIKNNHHIFSDIKNESFFYFVHSYFVEPVNKSEILSTTTYGCTFTSGVFRGNLVALQFHPEKSSTDGLKILKNFITWDIQ
tara:strand:- start:777 stop:1409 length:633 start_codon:yes stop_codon:yes gene_type:complete